MPSLSPSAVPAPPLPPPPDGFIRPRCFFDVYQEGKKSKILRLMVVRTFREWAVLLVENHLWIICLSRKRLLVILLENLACTWDLMRLFFPFLSANWKTHLRVVQRCHAEDMREFSRTLQRRQRPYQDDGETFTLQGRPIPQNHQKLHDSRYCSACILKYQC